MSIGGSGDGAFSRIPPISDKEFTFSGTTSDVDDVFVFQNIVVVAEYTISQESNVSTHIKKKKILFDKISQDPAGFIEFLKETFGSFAEKLDPDFEPHHFRIKILYCSRNALKETTKATA